MELGRRTIVNKIVALSIAILMNTVFLIQTCNAIDTKNSSKLKLSAYRQSMEVGETQRLLTEIVSKSQATVVEGKSVKYESTNTNVLKVEDGKVIATGEGMAAVTAKYENIETNLVFNISKNDKKYDSKDEKIEIKLNWHRTENELVLNWTESEFKEFKIVRKDLSNLENGTIETDGKGNSFRDKDLDPNKEYLYKIILKDMNNKEYPLNEFKLPTYKKAISKDLENKKVPSKNRVNKIEKTVKNINQSEKSNSEINEKELENIFKEIYEGDLEGKEEDKSQINTFDKDLIENRDDKPQIKTIYEIGEPIILSKDYIDSVNGNIGLGYTYNENIKVNEKNLTVHRILKDGKSVKLQNVSVDIEKHKINFNVSEEGIFVIRQNEEIKKDNADSKPEINKNKKKAIELLKASKENENKLDKKQKEIEAKNSIKTNNDTLKSNNNAKSQNEIKAKDTKGDIETKSNANLSLNSKDPNKAKLEDKNLKKDENISKTNLDKADVKKDKDLSKVENKIEPKPKNSETVNSKQDEVVPESEAKVNENKNALKDKIEAKKIRTQNNILESEIIRNMNPETYDKLMSSVSREFPAKMTRAARRSVDATMARNAVVYAGPGSSSYANVGSVSAGEKVLALASEWGWIYIDYKIDNSTQHKRGYVLKSQLQNANSVYDALSELYFTGYSDAVNRTVTVLTGPGENYTAVGTVYNGEGVSAFEEVEGNYRFVEFSTPSGTKRGYINNSYLQGRREGTLASLSANTKIYGVPRPNGALIGEVYTDELVVILDRNSIYFYLEYNTKGGRKRGYSSIGTLRTRGAITGVGAIKTEQSLGQSKSAQTVYSGPNENYAKMGSIGLNERVSILQANYYGYAYVEYGTKTGLKRGYVPSGGVTSISKTQLPNINVSSSYRNVYGESGHGRPLNYYKIGNGEKALVAVFAIHGFEDAWAGDGIELYKIAARTITDLVNHGPYSGWSVYIIPTANPDGIIDGFTNDGPGRCTVLEGTDLNRSFPTRFSPVVTGSRNFTGSTSLIAREGQALKTLITQVKSTHTSTSLLDFHGWENNTIGNNELGKYFGDQFGFGHNPSNGGNGFLISWGNAVGIKSTLVELPMPSSPQDIINRDYAGKVSRAIQNILRNGATASSNVNGFRQENGKTYYYKNGVRQTNWIEVGGKTYYFDDNGVMLTGMRTLPGGVTYLLNSQGELQRGWHIVNGKRYYFNQTGGMLKNTVVDNVRLGADGAARGWVELGQTAYYYDDNGVMLTGLHTLPGGVTYLLNSQGVLQRGWHILNGKRYYFNQTGGMLKNTVVDNVRLGADGAARGWVELGQTAYYYDDNGVMLTGLHTLPGGVTYLLNSQGVLQRGWHIVNGKRYYFNQTGGMLKNTVVDNVRLGADGAARGWVELGQTAYYYDDNGVMLTGLHTLPGGVTYLLNSQGELQRGWHTVNGKRYYFNQTGGMLKNTVIDGIRLGADGAAINTTTGGGTTGGTSSTGNNSGEVVTIITMTGSFILGLKDASVEAAKGFWQLITHPWQIVEGVAFIAKAVIPGTDENKLIVEMVTQTVNKFTTGNGNTKARMLGRLLGELLIGMISTKGLTAAVDLLKGATRAGKIGDILAPLGRETSLDSLINKLNEANVAGRIAEAVSKIRSVSSDFLNYVKDSIIDLGDRIAYRPALAGVSNDAFYYISKSEISDVNKLKSTASAAGRLTDESCVVASKASRAISMAERIAEYNKVMHNTSLKVSHTASETHSQILRKELYAANITAPPYGNACHHIVAWDANKASVSRGILSKYGIDFDSASNGVLLPYEKNSYVTTEAMHNGGHSNQYYLQVENHLKEAEKFIVSKNLSVNDGKMIISETLNNIRKDLLNGTLKIHN